MKICNKCHKEYKATSNVQKICVPCRSLICKTCGKKWIPDQIETHQFCSRKCYSLYQKTLKHEDSNAWKKSIGKSGVHVWLNRDYGKPKFCEACGNETIDRVYDWANISGEYLRSREDFLRLCRNCHRRFDMTPEKKAQAIRNLIWYSRI